ncbi:MAG: MerR family DNA-binding transcriptional regulator [Arsenophonus sp. NEOnobi-MAG3]
MYHIASLAKLTDIIIDTIRFYEKQGLMEIS